MRVGLSFAFLVAVVCCSRTRTAGVPATRPIESSAPVAQELCAHLRYDPLDPGSADAPTLCSRFRAGLLPSVAATTVQCMQEGEWSRCDVSRCAMGALSAAPKQVGDDCQEVQQHCADSSEACIAHISGMNEAGRKRFTSCLLDHCGKGVRYCLWDSMVSSCQ